MWRGRSFRGEFIVSLQFACGKLVSLVESESPLAPLRKHTRNLWRDSVFLSVRVSLTPLGLAFFLSIRLDSIISLQVCYANLLSLGWSESSLAPLRDHTLPESSP